jgi:hypothetical protein
MLNSNVLIGHTGSSANGLSSHLKNLCSWTRHHLLSALLVGFLHFSRFVISIYIFHTFKSFLKPCRLAPSPLPHRPFHSTLWLPGVYRLGSYLCLPWSRLVDRGWIPSRCRSYIQPASYPTGIRHGVWLRSKSLWRRYISANNMFLDVIHRHVFI